MLMKNGTRETGEMVGQAHALKVITKTQNFKGSALNFKLVFSDSFLALNERFFRETSEGP